MSKLSEALATTNKATKGPWVVQTTNPTEAQSTLGPQHVIIADHANSQTLPSNPVICSLVPYGFGVEGGAVDEQAANARLIAAAPGMAAWIQKALRPLRVFASDLRTDLDPAIGSPKYHNKPELRAADEAYLAIIEAIIAEAEANGGEA